MSQVHVCVFRVCLANAALWPRGAITAIGHSPFSPHHAWDRSGRGEDVAGPRTHACMSKEGDGPLFVGRSRCG